MTWASECSPSGRTAAAWLLSTFKSPRALAGLCVNVGVLVVFQFRPLSTILARSTERVLPWRAKARLRSAARSSDAWGRTCPAARVMPSPRPSCPSCRSRSGPGARSRWRDGLGCTRVIVCAYRMRSPSPTHLSGSANLRACGVWQASSRRVAWQVTVGRGCYVARLLRR